MTLLDAGIVTIGLLAPTVLLLVWFGRSDASRANAQQVADFACENLRLRLRIAELREQIVWCHAEGPFPVYYQGAEGEHEINVPITAQEANAMRRVVSAALAWKEDYRNEEQLVDALDALSGRKERA